MHTYIHAYIHKNIYTLRTHIYIHTHTQAYSPGSSCRCEDEEENTKILQKVSRNMRRVATKAALKERGVGWVTVGGGDGVTGRGREGMGVTGWRDVVAPRQTFWKS
jgi:hypothetical protein